jgi:serine phosphatase RsbU (regulator of sigma subunit)
MPRGALYVDSKAASRAFQPEDLALFHALAQHIAIALENAQLNLHSIERARLEKSLEIAAEIQAGLMPKSPPSMEGYDLFGWYRSAEHASGDFFDFVRTKSGGVAAVVGDVTGHGVGPALVTATAQASLRSYARVLEDPGSVVTMLNADLSERMDDGMFLTLFIAELDQDGRVQVLNAGHTPPLIWRAATKTIESISSDGPALGLMDDLVYETGDDLHLEVGDVLLAFSDGLVEARHPDHPERFFEEQGVRAVLSDRGHAGATAREIVESVAQAALEFAEGAREDDVTIVAIRRK